MKCVHTDLWCTPKPLYDYICNLVNVYPVLDVCAHKNYSMCENYYTKEDNALVKPWYDDSWCNAPGKHIQQFINRGLSEWKRTNKNYVFFVPLNTVSNGGFKDTWELFMRKQVEIYPLFGIRPKFLDGRLEEFKPMESTGSGRNGYITLVYRTQ